MQQSVCSTMTTFGFICSHDMEQINSVLGALTRSNVWLKMTCLLFLFSFLILCISLFRFDPVYFPRWLLRADISS
jgi:hypothetical protein